jgi:hypothetical protein
MKKAAFILGTISVIVLALGLLFRVHQWDGSGIILIFGMLLSVISLVTIAVYLAKTNSVYKKTYIFWSISTFIMIVGLFLKINHYSGSEILHTIGTGGFIISTAFFALKLFKSQ